MASGGVRQGTPGQAYANRTDMNLPQARFTGQQYGQAQQQQQWQQALPGGSQPSAAPASQATQGAPQPAGPDGQGSPTGPLPGQLPSLSDPSTRPGEPVTAGAASGPGPGPQALQTGLPMTSMADMLTSLARSTGSTDIAVLARHAQSLGQ